MTLSEKDGKLFYELWFPLLDYVNEKCKVNKRVKNIINIKSLNPNMKKQFQNVYMNAKKNGVVIRSL